jgi:hypothetical protein
MLAKMEDKGGPSQPNSTDPSLMNRWGRGRASVIIVLGIGCCSFLILSRREKIRNGLIKLYSHSHPDLAEIGKELIRFSL